MTELPDWAARWLERQSRVADAIARVAPFDRIPRAWLIRLAHAAALLGLLSVGVLANSPFAWAVIAIPMTMIVVLILSGRGRTAGAPSAGHARRRPFDALAIGSSVAEPAFDSPIVAVRRSQVSRAPGPRVVRRTR
jgi:hypothetical protein